MTAAPSAPISRLERPPLKPPHPSQRRQESKDVVGERPPAFDAEGIFGGAQQHDLGSCRGSCASRRRPGKRPSDRSCGQPALIVASAFGPVTRDGDVAMRDADSGMQLLDLGAIGQRVVAVLVDDQPFVRPEPQRGAAADRGGGFRLGRELEAQRLRQGGNRRRPARAAKCARLAEGQRRLTPGPAASRPAWAGRTPYGAARLVTFDEVYAPAALTPLPGGGR